MFEKCSRLKVRFDTNKGQLSIEDLWDLPLTSGTGKANLDDVARELYNQLKGDSSVSFVEKDKKSDPVLQLKFDVIKHVIDVRVAENETQRQARANAEKKQRLLAIIADKEQESVKSMSLDDLKAMVAAL